MGRGQCLSARYVGFVRRAVVVCIYLWNGSLSGGIFAFLRLFFLSHVNKVIDENPCSQTPSTLFLKHKILFNIITRPHVQPLCPPTQSNAYASVKSDLRFRAFAGCEEFTCLLRWCRPVHN